jgi:hypothetical protein
MHLMPMHLMPMHLMPMHLMPMHLMPTYANIAHAQLIALLVNQHMVRTFAGRVIAGATAPVPTDSVCVDEFSGAVRPTFRNRRAGFRSARFSACSLVLIQRVGWRGATITPRRSSATQIVCGCYGIELVVKEKCAMQARSKFRKRYCLRVHRA